ncbi:hypothetical protein [Morganella morganii]|uniref:hypothetical protein n=1 Tax=Morganella morganii TaxID=582 RepID=UPI000BBD11D2|nr:hypothetical protein [Morganella morganii]ATF52676.1 hypothetical protein CO693_02660 [Morganella morganii]
MGRQIHIGYHNCRDEGGYDFLRENVPFLSGEGDNQWLTQGYYFWTDDTYWAERWNQGKQVTISKFTITFHEDDELLDLVGNTRQICEFQKMRTQVAQKLDIKDVGKITVSQVIAFFRKLNKETKSSGIFPYLAVKAQDAPHDSRFLKMLFTRYRREHLCLATRQQMCVFAHAKDRIDFSCFMSPKEYTEQN